MRLGCKAIDLTPEEFEKLVKCFLAVAGARLDLFEAAHREKIERSDGTYEIDVTARFRALGVGFLVLVECKKQTKPVEREVVQVLFDRVRATGAHKGIIFSTGGFQSGAITYAKEHGIALVSVAPGDMLYQVRDLHSSSNIIAFRAGKFSIWSCRVENGQETYAAVICTEDALRALDLKP